MRRTIRQLGDTSGATAIEYGLIAGLLIVAIVSALNAITTRAEHRISGMFSSEQNVTCTPETGEVAPKDAAACEERLRESLRGRTVK